MERENSLRHILHLAYDKNSAKQEERTDNSYDIDKFEDNVTNYYDKYYEILDGLYCFINMIKEPPEGAKKRWIDTKNLRLDVNEYTKCLILTLMTMNSNSPNTFIAKLRNKRFDDITESDKQEYLNAFIEELKEINPSCTFDFLYENFSAKLIENGEDPNNINLLSREFHDQMRALIDKIFIQHKFQTDIHNYIEIILDDISKNIKNVVEKVFPNSKNLNIPFPTQYGKFGESSDCIGSIKHKIEMMKKDCEDPGLKFLTEFPEYIEVYSLVDDGNKENFEYHPTRVFNVYEKKELIDKLNKKVNETLKNWLIYVREYAKEIIELNE